MFKSPKDFMKQATLQQHGTTATIGAYTGNVRVVEDDARDMEQYNLWFYLVIDEKNEDTGETEQEYCRIGSIENKEIKVSEDLAL